MYSKQILMTKAAHGTSGSVFAPGNRVNPGKAFLGNSLENNSKNHPKRRASQIFSTSLAKFFFCW